MNALRILRCILYKNECWGRHHADHLEPSGITVHSTDPAQGWLWRFVQPFDGQTEGLADGDEPVTAAQMLDLLGVNSYGTAWNKPGVYKCVHAFLGKLRDGSYAVAETLDLTQPCWGGAFGSKGSYDGRVKKDGQNVAGGTLHINFEMIEDEKAVHDRAHCKALYELAVAYCVHLCRRFPTIRVENIVSHKEAAAKGYASDHGDPESYWARCGTGYTMEGFRADVRAALQADEESIVYRVQVGAFRVRAYAEAMLAKVREHFPEAYIAKGTK